MIEFDPEGARFLPLPLGRAVFASSLQLEEALCIRVGASLHMLCMFELASTALPALTCPKRMLMPCLWRGRAHHKAWALSQAEMAQAMRQLDLTSDLQASWWGACRWACHTRRCQAAVLRPCQHGMTSQSQWSWQLEAQLVLFLPTLPAHLPSLPQPCFLSVSPYHLPDMTDRQWRKLFAEWSHAPVVGWLDWAAACVLLGCSMRGHSSQQPCMPHLHFHQ